jgi:hypothetical protein
MKKLLLCTAIAVFGLSNVNAQEVKFGAKAGVNFASVGGDETGDLDGRTSFHIGGVAEIVISEKFSFQPELLYSAQGAKASGSEPGFGSFESEYKFDYLNIPLMAKFYVAEGFSLEAGPQIGFLLSAKDDWTETFDGFTDSGTDDLKDYTKGIDFGLNFGLGYKMETGLNFGARYNLGLSNINDGEGFDDFKNQNSVIQISVGYMF